MEVVDIASATLVTSKGADMKANNLTFKVKLISDNKKIKKGVKYLSKACVNLPNGKYTIDINYPNVNIITDMNELDQVK